jgi:hypothetical protein
MVFMNIVPALPSRPTDILPLATQLQAMHYTLTFYQSRYAQKKRWSNVNREGTKMSFVKESTGYEKTIIADLQGGWNLLRQEVVDAAGFDGWERALFHVDEAMSWETVRDLRRMPPLLLVIRNICAQGNAPEEVMESLGYLDETLKEVFDKGYR